MERVDIEGIKEEQYAVICFLIRQGMTVKQTLDELWKADTTDEILSKKTTYQWYNVLGWPKKSTAAEEWLLN